MVTYTDNRELTLRVDALLERGELALEDGDRRKAHDFWREAAVLNPYDERVWLALYDVLELPEDRRVCLENVIAINPFNTHARQQLRHFETPNEREARARNLQREREQKRRRSSSQSRPAITPSIKKLPPKRQPSFGDGLLRGILVGLCGVLIGVLLSILIYGMGLIDLPPLIQF